MNDCVTHIVEVVRPDRLDQMIPGLRSVELAVGAAFFLP